MSDKTQEMVDNALDVIYPEIPDEKLPQATVVKETTVTTYNVESSASKDQEVWKYVIIGVVVLIFIIIVWIVCYNYFSVNDTTDSSTENYEVDTNVGAIIQEDEYYIVSGKLRKRMREKFQIITVDDNVCDYGYYGDGCKFQAHSIKYYNAGTFDSIYSKEIVPGNHPLSLNYSFEDGTKDRNSLTSMCDSRNDCKGVIYDHNTNTGSLITSDVVAKGVSSLDYSLSSQMYLKKSETPKFTDMAIGFSGSTVLRHYMTRTGQLPDLIQKRKTGSKKDLRVGIVHFHVNDVVNTIWVPYKIANYGGLVGLYSDKEFTINNWQNVDMIYTDEGTGEYNLPLFLQEYSSLYILYISSSDYTTGSS